MDVMPKLSIRGASLFVEVIGRDEPLVRSATPIGAAAAAAAG